MKTFFTAALLAINSVSFSQINSGLVAYWPLDGNVKNTIDNKLDGIIKGNVISAIDRFGNSCAMKMIDISSYIEIMNPLKIDSSLGVSFSFWTRMDVVNDSYNYLAINAITFDTANCKSNGCSKQILEQTAINNSMPLCSLWVSSDRYAGDYLFEDCTIKKWNYYVFMFSPKSTSEPSSLVFYKNNTRLTSFGGGIHLFPESFKKIILGQKDKFWNDISQYQYSMDDVRIYNRILSPTEIAELYNLPSSCLTTSTSENQIIKTENKKVVFASDILGKEINDPNTFSGIMIVYYSDGSRKKILNATK